MSGNVIQHAITVEQLGTYPNILIDYSNDVVPFTGTILACQVVSNIAWTVVIEDDDNWIEIVEPVVTRSFITEDLFLKIASNIGAARTGKAIVNTVGDYVLSRTIEVVQENVKNTLRLEQDECIIPYRCKNLTIDIEQEHAIEYDIVSTETWITLDRMNSTMSEVILNIEDNSSVFPRTATVTIKNSVIEQKVEIFQYGRPDTSIGDDPSAGQLLAFPGAEGGGRFTTGGRGGEERRVGKECSEPCR